MLGCGGVLRTRISFSPRVGYFFKGGKVKGAGLLSTIRCLSFYGDRVGAPSSRLVGGNRSVYILRNGCSCRKHRRRVFYTVHHQRQGRFGQGGGRCSGLSRRVNLLPLIVISPTSSRLVRNKDRRHHHFLSIVVSRRSGPCLRTLVRCGGTLLRQGSLLGSRYVSTSLCRILRVRLSVCNQVICRGQRVLIGSFVPVFGRCCRAVYHSARRINLQCVSRLRGKDLTSVLTTGQRHSHVLNCASANVRGSRLRVALGNRLVHHINSRKRGGACLVTLGLTRCIFLSYEKRTHPVLLLSSVFSGLSTSQIRRVIGLIDNSRFKRVFVASAGQGCLSTVLRSVGRNCTLFEIRRNRIRPVRRTR